ncbi:hypothetical protein ID144_08655 [Pseudomonas sp. JM0905a]|nr:hypothetical protein [Pseudomonas sp. JM0905a]MBD2837104.1 hypothetical protein [Pseudomonas sp. JM0905a]
MKTSDLDGLAIPALAPLSLRHQAEAVQQTDQESAHIQDEQAGESSHLA